MHTVKHQLRNKNGVFIAFISHGMAVKIMAHFTGVFKTKQFRADNNTARNRSVFVFDNIEMLNLQVCDGVSFVIEQGDYLTFGE